MAMFEDDLDQLEQFLDGALNPSEVSQLNLRLQSDPELTVLLSEVTSQRALRTAAWECLEPTTVDAERLTWRIRGAVLDQHRQNEKKSTGQFNPWRVASFSSAAAACLIFGFFLGHIGRSPNAASPSLKPTEVASTDNQNSRVTVARNNEDTGAPPHFIADGQTPKISVPVTNEWGQVVAWQTFDNADQAKNFTEDLGRTRARTAAPAIVGQPRLVDQQVPF